MNVAEPFIRRPVATTLLVLSILIFGIMGYRLLPVERPAHGGLSHDPGERRPARREPGNDGGVGGDAAREAVRHDCRCHLDQFLQHARQHQHHAAVRSEQVDRRGRAGRAVDDRAGAAAAAAGDAVAAVVPEGEPRRRAGAVPHAELAHAAAAAAGPLRAEPAGPAPVDGDGRGPGERVRIAEVRGPRGRRSPAARVADDRDRPGGAGDRRRERQPADGHAVRARAQLRDPDVGAAAGSRRVPVDRRRLPERQPGAPERGGARVRGCRERAQRGVVQRRAHHLPRRFSGSLARTPWTWWTASRRCCRASSSSCRRRSSSGSGATGRCPSASRSTT